MSTISHHCRDEKEVATCSAGGLTHQGSAGTPADSPSTTPTPSPPRQCVAPQPGSRPQASRGGSRLTGSKRALSSRSNQDSARQLMTKQRIGRASAVGVRSSAEARRISCAADASRSLDDVANSGQGLEGGQGEAGRAVPVGPRSKALLRRSVDLKQGDNQAVPMTKAESLVEAEVAAARKAGGKKVGLC